MRILIIGNSGSGKTYLSDLLSRVTGIEKIDIDTLYDKYPHHILFKKSHTKAINKLTHDKKDWIIDGYHISRMPESSFKNADIIIHLNLPSKELKKNVFDRYKIKKATREFSHWQSTYINTLKNYAQIKFQDKSLKQDVSKIKDIVNDKAKFVELKSRNEIQQFVDSFRNQSIKF